ncbi:MAG: isoprenylcysteine carboxylmethyltransferase family protein [Candidatus Omnitrophota bacterium]|nr:isoprenylcysteine carboxylmethyltransferase family protein [Candidatus Omnitrophota bacterium]
MKPRIRTQGISIFLAVLTAVFLSKFLFPRWKGEAADEFLDILGIFVLLFGFLIRVVARGYKSEKSWNGRSLMLDGLYGLVRHPMYFGTLLIGLGTVSILFQWWAFLVFLLIFLVIYTPQVRKEENSLLQLFGEEYKAYCRKTPKYFPNKNFFRVNPRDYLFFKWAWVKKELSSLIAVSIIIIALETWQDIRIFGRNEFLKEALEFLLAAVFFITLCILFCRKENVLRKS